MLCEEVPIDSAEGLVLAIAYPSTNVPQVLINLMLMINTELQDIGTHFFRRWDFRQLHPQVLLTRENNGPLIPDFVLVDAELQRATVLDLKLPSARIVRRQLSRDSFAASIVESRAQLLKYRDWFEQSQNRQRMKDQIGMTIYRPHIAVIIGWSQEFVDELDRAGLISRESDIEIVTYDDILTTHVAGDCTLREATIRRDQNAHTKRRSGRRSTSPTVE